MGAQLICCAGRLPELPNQTMGFYSLFADLGLEFGYTELPSQTIGCHSRFADLGLEFRFLSHMFPWDSSHGAIGGFTSYHGQKGGVPTG